MSIEQLGYARPDLRNPSLAVMSEALTSAENRYSGIPTMRRTMKEYGLQAPKFENRRDEFVVTFYNTKEEQSAVREKTGSQESLLEFCHIPRTRQEIAAFLGIRTVSYAMEKFVRPLLETGQLSMTIPEKPRSSKQKYFAG